ELARQNAARHSVTERIQFVQGASLDSLPAELHFDFLIGNPPYIPTGDLAALQPEVRDFDPRMALDGGLDGLDFYRQFAAEAPSRLTIGGKLMLEFGDGQAEAIRSIFEQQNWNIERIMADYSGRPRIIVANRA